MTEIQDMNLIRKIAWSYAKTTGLEFDELFGVAAVGYARAQNEYDPEKTKWSTWAWTTMRRELNSYLVNESRRNAVYDPDPKGGDNPEKHVEFKEEIGNLSQEAQTVCRTIFSSPAEFLAYGPKASRGKIKDMLREQGWSWNRIWGSFREIKSLVNETA